jgi:hypothetical protein
VQYWLEKIQRIINILRNNFLRILPLQATDNLVAEYTFGPGNPVAVNIMEIPFAYIRMLSLP